MVGRLCRSVGWQYWVLGPVDVVYQRNVTWLAGYRHPRYGGGPDVARAVWEAFADRRPLVDGVAEVGDPIRVVPAVFHALWSGGGSVMNQVDTLIKGDTDELADGSPDRVGS